MRDGPDRPVPVPAGRLARLTRLGSLTAGVAGNMALNGVAQLGRGQRPVMRDLLLTPANARRIADQLAQMRGAAMKVGQLMSMDTGDVLPPELTEILGRLRQDAHTMPPAQLKAVLNAAWGTDWLRAFQRFDVRPIAAASIGQVHRAQLKDGRDLAIKVQYPGVAGSIDADVANVGALIRMTGLLPKGFELAPYLEEARQQLHEETDYALEAAHLQRFGALVGPDARFKVPEFYADWSGPTVLAMEYVPSQPIEEVAAADQADRNRVAEALLDLLLTELFRFGVMQTDPNFANFRYQPETGRIVLLDFGATRSLPPALVEHYRRLVQAGLAQDRAGLAAVAREIGFFGAETAPQHQTAIVGMIAEVFDQVGATDSFAFADPTLSDRMQRQGAALAEAGFVPPPVPIDVLFLQRKLGGIFLLGAKLGARLPVRAILDRHLSTPVLPAT